MAIIEDLMAWIERDLSKHSLINESISWLNSERNPAAHLEPLPENTLRFKIYTDKNSYQIVAHERDKNSYLGCQGSSRKPRAGEDWTRGNDLHDGDFSEETWHRILGDILSYEMVKIHKLQEPETVEEILVDPKPVNE